MHISEPHISERFDLPEGYVARAYRGAEDHPAMATILTEYRASHGQRETVTAEQMDASYRNLRGCDPDNDVYVVEFGSEPIGYGRTIIQDLAEGPNGFVFIPTHPDHVQPELFTALVGGLEAHALPSLEGRPGAHYSSPALHPGPGKAPTGEAAWLEGLGYEPRHWEAELVRPDLENIPERTLPEGVELRPVTEDQIRQILVTHHEAFSDDWDYVPVNDADIAVAMDNPLRDESLWQVAWVGDQVVGQVKPYINADENRENGYLRGHTEEISTHVDWRNRGIAGTLLTYALKAIKERGMTEAALGVDTNSPGGAFHLYQSLGFEVDVLGAIFEKPAG